MAAPPRRLKDLGKVVDGRIRKSWPFVAFGGSVQTKNTRAKGFNNDSLSLCYRNAVLQCLLHTPEFLRYLEFEERCSTPGDGCVFCALRNLALRYWTCKRKDFTQDAVAMVNTAMESHPPRNSSDRNRYGFLRSSASSPINMAASGQQDAHEYFMGLFNMLAHINNDMIHGINNVAVDRLFRIRMKTTWECGDCGVIHSKRDKDIGLQLAIPYTKLHQTSLHDCLDDYFADEDVEGVECDSQTCNGKRGSRTREHKIVGGPEILVIQLKRAWMNPYTGSTRKILDRVDMGERLDLSPWSNGVLTYQLNGIVAHHGDSLKSGHYIAMVRSPNGVDFAKCNDMDIDDHPREKASILEEPKTKEWQSYMLVYQKIGGKMAKCI